MIHARPLPASRHLRRALQLARRRRQLAELLWQSVEPDEEARFLAIPDWQRRILDERLAEMDRNPDDVQTWDEVKAEIWPES